MTRAAASTGLGKLVYLSPTFATLWYLIGSRVASEVDCIVLRFLVIFAALWAAVGSAAVVMAEPIRRAQAYTIVVQPPAGNPVRLHIQEFGSGPPMLLLHGVGGSGYSFRHIIEALARTHRVIALDLMGFGASEKPFNASYRPTEQAHLVVAFLRQSRLHGVTLVGHSLGGTIALMTVLDLNRREPGRISRLILMNAPAYPQDLPRTQQFLTLPVLPYLALAVVPPILNTRALLQTKRRAAQPATDADAMAYAEPLYDAAGRHALIATTRAIAETDGRDVIPFYRTIRQPTLLIWCRHDPTVPLATGQRLARALPRAELQILEQCDHTPAEEQPVQTQAVMRAFMGRAHP